MSFKFGDDAKKQNKVFDLYLLIMTSLDKACKDFIIENAKSKFDHKKIKSLKDTDKHKKEVLAYLRLDVLGLKELFEVFERMDHSQTILTISHIIFQIIFSAGKRIAFITDKVKDDLQVFDVFGSEVAVAFFIFLRL